MIKRKRIPGFNNYEVTTEGRVYSMQRKHNGSEVIDNKEKLMKSTDVPGDYTLISLVDNDGVRKSMKVHRLVALTFLDKPKSEEKLVVNHLDGNKHNNVLSNLEWCTYAENSQHAFAIGLSAPAVGEDNPQSKISEAEARDIIKDLLKGATNSEVSTAYGLHERYVSLIRHRRRWKYLWDSEFAGLKAPKSAKEIVVTKPKLYKVTEQDQDIIIPRIVAGESLKKLAEEFNLDPSTLSHVKAKRSWKPAWRRLNLI